MKVVITVARYSPHKNHRQLIAIARELIAYRSDVMFLWVGDGPLFSEVQDLVRRSGLSEKIRFVRSRPSIVDLYKSADLFLFPSLMEGFGLVIVEVCRRWIACCC